MSVESARRQIRFESYQDAIAEIDRLRSSGYERLGNWTLGQICSHLSFYLRGTLEGFGFKLPWLVRKLVGEPVLRRILKRQRMAAGMRTAPASVPHADVNEDEAIEESADLLRRLDAHVGELHPSPIFGRLSAERWRVLHLAHCAHHLSFLLPKSTGGANSR